MKYKHMVKHKGLYYPAGAEVPVKGEADSKVPAGAEVPVKSGQKSTK